jgi:hypothetical protein
MVWLDANWVRVAGYLVAATASCVVGLRELGPARSDNRLWPPFWFLAGGLLVMMAIGRTGDVGHWLSSLGRRMAVSEGWYASRRKPQAVAVASVAAIGMLTTIVVLWRVKERRRRYVPTALSIFTLLCFAGIRVVSLHEVDDVVYRVEVAGMPLDAAVELALLFTVITVTVRQLRRGSLPARTSPSSALVESERARGPG